jgi:hypothetical protein
LPTVSLTLRLCEGVGNMTKPDEYRTNAWECERMAKNSIDFKDKTAWLQMAQHWLRMIPTERFEAAQDIGQTKPGKH